MDLAPKEIVNILDKSVVGQSKAKKALAIALRNRDRVGRIKDDSLKGKVKRKNVLFVGPTGVGKTELVSCACSIYKSPFVKCDATKFTEIGYVGRDVESMIQDLVERSVALQRELLLKEAPSEEQKEEVYKTIATAILKKLNTPVGHQSILDCVERFKSGQYDDMIIEIHVQEKESFTDSVFAPMNIDPGVMPGAVAPVGIVPFGDFLKAFSGHKDKVRRLTAKKAFQMLLDHKKSNGSEEDIVAAAMKDAQERGIIFIDEIDKLINSKTNPSRGDVSREGVQRDLLPLVEGAIVQTKYGPFDTAQVLFVAAGAFHAVKPTDLLTELQGRFPIKVNLTSLTTQDFVKILTEPELNIVRQAVALLAADDVEIVFKDSGIVAMAEYATKLNSFFENIGARRLYGVLETVVEDVSFNAPNGDLTKVEIDAEYVHERMKGSFDENHNKKENHII